jgi:hypothetical protein
VVCYNALAHAANTPLLAERATVAAKKIVASCGVLL